MSRFILFILILLISGTSYGKTAKSTLILLSIDGFAYDYLATYKPKNILEFAKSGAGGKLLPVYPSKTFPNHLSIITGNYPEKHGIIHNKFYHPHIGEKYQLGAGKDNSAWLTAKPFWTFVEENNISSAVYFWPESEVKGQGRPTYNIPFNKITSSKTQFDQIIDWLKLPNNQAPSFIASYFSSIDEAGHKFGLGSIELAQAVTNIDTLFGEFIKRLQQEIPQPVNVILLSDHGMVQIDKDKSIDLSMVFNKRIIKLITEKSVIVAQSSTQLFVYFDQDKLSQHQQNIVLQEVRDKQKLNSTLYHVYQQSNYPNHWRFNNNLDITPDFIIEAEPTASFISKNYASSILATHGYDALNHSELSAIFFASGPDIVNGRAVNPFENIHIVPLMSQLLGIKPPDNIDGNAAVLAPILKIN
jgi:predicted AlkP superfamily pyrophosphatase or phosphodiesterase